VKKIGRSFYRSLLVSLAALGVLVWVTLDQFDVPRREMVALLFGTLSVAAGVILLSALFAGVWITLRKWRSRGETSD